jgi:hypothetical protein
MPSKGRSPVDLDRGCFACMLGGAEWRGPMSMLEEVRTGRVLTVRVPTPRAGWP